MTTIREPPPEDIIQSAWETGDATRAWAVLEATDDVESRPGLLAWRARLLIDRDEDGAAADDIRRLLELPGRIDTGPRAPGLTNLIESLRVDVRSQVRGELLQLIAEGILVANDPNLIRLVQGAPINQWPDAFLASRLRDERSPERLEALIQEAHGRDFASTPWLAARVKAAEQRLGTMTHTTERRRSTERAHPLLAAAFQEIPRGMRPPPPCHLGGPAPILTVPETLRVIVWCAEQIVPWSGSPECAEVVAQARRLLENPNAGVRRRLMRFVNQTLQDPSADPMIRVAAQAVQVTEPRRSVREGTPMVIGRDLVRAVARILRTAPTPPRMPEEERDHVVRTFLVHLDELLMEAELRRTLRKVDPNAQQRLAHASLRIRYRGENANNAMEAWIVDWPGGAGLLVRIQRQWQWIEGDLRGLLAHLPEHHFEAALASLESSAEASPS